MHPIQDLILSLLTRSALDSGSFTSEQSSRLESGLEQSLVASPAEAIEGTLEVVGLLIQKGAQGLAESLVALLSKAIEQAQSSVENDRRRSRAKFEEFCGDSKPRTAAPAGPILSLRSLYTPRRF